MSPAVSSPPRTSDRTVGATEAVVGGGTWAWPVVGPVVRGFDPPQDPYGSGHRGIDIVAPLGTPIRATFDGVASDATNIYGGKAVYVQGQYGSTYNAHMTSIAQLGPVQAGDVIGYVGSDGLAGGEVNHNHFEFRPSVMPSNWPASYYGYSIIEDAINPYPLLVAACG
jgi:murein DD-endopeptidase MepM/ murein hydrolase activator NlpD